MIDQLPSTNATWFQQEVLPPSQCIGIWHGRHTLTRGKTYLPFTPQMHKTSTEPNSILFSNIHTSWKKLQHLWKRTTGNNEISSPLMTISRMDEGTLHDPYWSCQPTILEVTKESQPTNCMMACRPPRIWLWNQTYPWKHQHTRGCIVKTTQRKPRQRRQPKHCYHPTWEVPSQPHDHLTMWEALPRPPDDDNLNGTRTTTRTIGRSHHYSPECLPTRLGWITHGGTSRTNQKQPKTYMEEPWRQTCHPTRPRNMTKDHGSLAWLPDCRTPRMRWNKPTSDGTILLARSPAMIVKYIKGCATCQ